MVIDAHRCGQNGAFVRLLKRPFANEGVRMLFEVKETNGLI